MLVIINIRNYLLFFAQKDFSTTLRFARNDDGKLIFSKKMFVISKKVVFLHSVL